MDIKKYRVKPNKKLIWKNSARKKTILIQKRSEGRNSATKFGKDV